jgi:uncharacterized protein YndB with AHSA1/START domain
MTASPDQAVLKTVTVRAGVERAFRVFTEGFDTWWPHSHHIGSSPMTKAVIECRVGGRCYSQQEDGADCPWGQILEWEPPRRFVLAWMITPQWKYQPDLSQASEVEVKFTALADGSTRVDLEHRYFERGGEGWQQMREGVNSQGGWGMLLELFAAKASEESEKE